MVEATEAAEMVGCGRAVAVRARNLTMGMTEADATGAGVRAVAEMVEQARAAEVKAAVEKAAAAAARVAMAAMRQPVASESKYVHHNGPPARSIACKRYVTQGRPFIVTSIDT